MRKLFTLLCLFSFLVNFGLANSCCSRVKATDAIIPGEIPAGAPKRCLILRLPGERTEEIELKPTMTSTDLRRVVIEKFNLALDHTDPHVQVTLNTGEMAFYLSPDRRPIMPITLDLLTKAHFALVTSANDSIAINSDGRIHNRKHRY